MSRFVFSLIRLRARPAHFLILLLVFSGCAHRSKQPALARDWPAAPPLPRDTERRIDAVAHFAAGLSQEMNNQTAAATTNFYQAALNDIDHEGLVLEVARRLVAEEKPAEAISLLKEATERPDASGQLFAWLGLAHLQSGATNLAIQANQEAIKRGPDSLAAHQNLAQLFLQVGKTNEALSLIERASARTNSSPEFLLGLGELIGRFNRQQLYTDEDSRARILSLLDRAVAGASDNPLIQQRTADLYLLHGQPQKAEPIYSELFKKYPHAPGLKEKLANIYIRTDNHEKATELLQTIRDDNPTDPSTHYFLGSLAYEAKEFDKAADSYETALRLNPNFEPIYYDLAGVNLARRRPEEALQILNQARNRFKLGFLLEFYTGLAKAAMEDHAAALSHFTSAELLAKTSEPNRLTHSFYFQLGASFERTGNIPESVKAFRKCLELSPEFSEALNYLGYMWAERGENLPEARGMIEKALAQEPDNAAYLDSMAWVLYQLKDYTQALHYMLLALKHSEEPDPTLLEHLGDIHLGLEDPAKAREAYEKALAIKPSESIQKKLDALNSR